MTASWQAISRTLAGRGDVFINYRHDDVPGEAGRLFDRLSERFPGRVFRDIAGITPSENYVERIQHELSSCRAFLVLIGKRWLDAVDESGRRRLENPSDWVRLEIATVLQRGICVIPVLVENAEMPKADQLPRDLTPLAFLQAHVLPEAYFDPGVDRLVEVLEQSLGKAHKRPGESAQGHRGLRVLLTVVGLVILALATNRYWNEPQRSPTDGVVIPPQSTRDIHLTLPEVPALPTTPPPQPQFDTTDSAKTLQMVGSFLVTAAAAEIEAFRTGDASRVAFIYQGNSLGAVEQGIAVLRQRGLMRQSRLDAAASYVRAIRSPSPGVLEVDACELWSGTYSSLFTGVIVGTESPHWVPQTLTIRKLSEQLFVTDVKSYPPPAFCNR